jgi:hypothetical protein
LSPLRGLVQVASPQNCWSVRPPERSADTVTEPLSLGAGDATAAGSSGTVIAAKAAATNVVMVRYMACSFSGDLRGLPVGSSARVGVRPLPRSG